MQDYKLVKGTIVESIHELNAQTQKIQTPGEYSPNFTTKL